MTVYGRERLDDRIPAEPMGTLDSNEGGPEVSAPPPAEPLPDPTLRGVFFGQNQQQTDAALERTP